MKDLSARLQYFWQMDDFCTAIMKQNCKIVGLGFIHDFFTKADEYFANPLGESKPAAGSAMITPSTPWSRKARTYSIKNRVTFCNNLLC